MVLVFFFFINEKGLGNNVKTLGGGVYFCHLQAVVANVNAKNTFHKCFIPPWFFWLPCWTSLPE